MKTIIAITASLGLLAGVASAGCGKKVNVTAKLVKYDADTKVLTVEPASKKPLTLTAKAEILDKEGKKAKIEDLVGQEGIVITHEHEKVEKVSFAKAEEPKEEKKEEKKS